MYEQRRQILRMLAEGKISADEAEALIDALEPGQPETSSMHSMRSPSTSTTPT